MYVMYVLANGVTLEKFHGWEWGRSSWKYLIWKRINLRSLWCTGFTDPPKPSGWYRKYIGNRTIEETSANQKILTSLELIKLIGQYRFFYLYCSLLWFEMAKGSTFEKTFAGLLVKLKLFLRNKKKEKKRHSDYRCWHCHVH